MRKRIPGLVAWLDTRINAAMNVFKPKIRAIAALRAGQPDPMADKINRNWNVKPTLQFCRKHVIRIRANLPNHCATCGTRSKKYNPDHVSSRERVSTFSQFQFSKLEKPQTASEVENPPKWRFRWGSYRPVARKILQPRHYFKRCARIKFYKLLLPAQTLKLSRFALSRNKEIIRKPFSV